MATIKAEAAMTPERAASLWRDADMALHAARRKAFEAEFVLVVTLAQAGAVDFLKLDKRRIGYMLRDMDRDRAEPVRIADY